MASVKYRLQKAWPRSHSDPIMPWISEVNCLFTLHRSETIVVILFYIVSISTLMLLLGNQACGLWQLLSLTYHLWRSLKVWGHKFYLQLSWPYQLYFNALSSCAIRKDKNLFFHYFPSNFAFTVNRQHIVIITLDTIALQWKC